MSAAAALPVASEAEPRGGILPLAREAEPERTRPAGRERSSG
jgi:hypothetical protein